MWLILTVAFVSKKDIGEQNGYFGVISEKKKNVCQTKINLARFLPSQFLKCALIFI